MVKIIVVLRLRYVDLVPAMVKTIMVPRLCHVDPVPAMANSCKNYSNCVMSIFNVETHENLSKLIISFNHGLQL